MAGYIGEFSHSIDAKGRVIVPVRFRDELGDDFVISKGIDTCLYIYDREQWTILEEKIEALPLSNARARKFTSQFFSGASPCEVDKQGRILIPQKLREYAGLTKDVAVIGSGNHIEIWNSETWDKFNDVTPEEMAQSIEDLGF